MHDNDNESRPQSHGGASAMYERINNIPVELSVQVGKAKVSVQELLNVSEGEVIALNSSVDDAFDIFANDKKVGQGELVESENKLFLKVTSLVGENDD